MNCKLQTTFVGSYELRGLIKTPSLCRIGVMAAYDPSKVKVTVRVRYSAPST